MRSAVWRWTEYRRMSSLLYVCWTIDCESSHPAVNDLELGRRAIAGFADVIEIEGWRATFFSTPQEATALSDSLGRVAERGHEIGLHPHPLASGYRSDYLGTYSEGAQTEIALRGSEVLSQTIGRPPSSCRPGFGSANDGTFRALAAAGFKQTSASFPGRRMPKLASIWAGAPLFAHYTHPYNRCLEGGLDLVELPISVDWESMVWDGAHPLDLRVEFTDAKNHAFLIEKLVRRQTELQLPLQALIVLTHNIFRYDLSGDFRRATVHQMAADIRRIADQCGLQICGARIADAAAAYRASVPFEPAVT